MVLDFALIHAPSVYDFRDRSDVLFAYLSNSDSVHVSPIFEMPPVGIFALEQHVRSLGMKAQFYNVASRMLRDPGFDVEGFFEKIPARFVGFDLHWLVHCHGALELAELFQKIHPTAKTVFGGIASTYFHEELIGYPQVNYIVRGYDTLLPVGELLRSNNEPRELTSIPNLSWKMEGEAHHNPMTHVPRVFSAAIDWSQVFHSERRGLTPYNIVIPQAGCEYNCKWCGGSRYFFRKYMGLEGGPSRVHKSRQAFADELMSIAKNTQGRHTVTTIDFWHEYEELFSVAEDIFIDNTKLTSLSSPHIASVHYSLHRLPRIAKAERMANHIRAVIELSPDSHDHEIAKASGRGTYTMDHMETFIDELIDKVYMFEIYYMIGLPKQTVESVLEMADYCEHLLTKYRGKRVIPFICPMLPFLDPGSEIADAPEKHGYFLRFTGLENHRTHLINLNWKDRLNYETQWMTRDQLVDVSYESVRKLTVAKNRVGMMPDSFAEAVTQRIDETRNLLKDIDEWQALPATDQAQGEGQLKARVKRYNDEQLRSVMSQQRPIDLGFTKQQWFDTDEAIDDVVNM